jgi:hypothetical protein
MNEERDICKTCGYYGYRAAEHCAECRCNDLEIKFLPGAFSLVTAEPAESLDAFSILGSIVTLTAIRLLFGIYEEISPERFVRLELCCRAFNSYSDN